MLNLATKTKFSLKVILVATILLLSINSWADNRVGNVGNVGNLGNVNSINRDNTNIYIDPNTDLNNTNGFTYMNPNTGMYSNTLNTYPAVSPTYNTSHIVRGAR